MIEPRKCEQCGAEFTPSAGNLKKGNGRFCSVKCAAQKRTSHQRVERFCLECGVTFVVPTARIRTRPANFCSRECFLSHAKENAPGKTVVERTCQHCGKVFSVAPSQLNHREPKYCSLDCTWTHWRETGTGPRPPVGSPGPNLGKSLVHSGSFRSGEGHWNWRGGVSRGRYPGNWRYYIRGQVRERDGFTCQVCGVIEVGREHHVHHIDGDKENVDLHNLVTLCISCHLGVRTRTDTPFSREHEAGWRASSLPAR
jgi:5-methylcytosine-specific restriction endonuclease McrA